MDDFIGENLMSNGVFKGITVAKGNADPKNEDKNDNEVDAIAGATITGDGVSAMIKADLKLYVPYFENLKTKGFYNSLDTLHDLDANGDIKFEIDFRTIYATVLSKWLGANDEAVLNHSFQHLNFI